MVVSTGPFFGGKIAVEDAPEDGSCAVLGDPDSPKDAYTLDIDHKLCGSRLVVRPLNFQILCVFFFGVKGTGVTGVTRWLRPWAIPIGRLRALAFRKIQSTEFRILRGSDAAYGLTCYAPNAARG